MKLLSRLIIALLICPIAILIIAPPVQATSIRLSPSHGNVGENIDVTGTFSSHLGDTVYIYYEVTEDEWKYVDSASIDIDTSELERASFDVPESYSGEHEVRVCYSKSDSHIISGAYDDFTVEPKIAIVKPTSEEGPAGTEIELKGLGWDDRESKIEIRFYLKNPGTRYYDDDDYYVVVASENIEVDDYGTWEDITFDVPTCKKGDHWIYAVGNKSDDIKDDDIKGVEFEVLPGISLDTESGSPGDTITVTGSGFEEDEEDIEILFNGDVVTEDIEADEDGCWTGTFEVPEVSKGDYDVAAQGEDTDKDDIEEVEFEVVPGLVLSPTEGHVGTTLTVSGAGFPASKSVTITYDGVSEGSSTTNSNGSFSNISFAATHTQTTHVDEHPVVATYDSTTVTANFIMESDAPPLPTLTSPANGARAGSVGMKFSPTFVWQAVSDDSGVSYNLQVGVGANFTQVIISKTELSDPSYTLTAEEALPYGTYYWSVKAIDGAQNDSGWATPYSFKSGLLPFWAVIAITALIVVLIGALIYLLVKRRAPYD